jgi:hypothetical protein
MTASQDVPHQTAAGAAEPAGPHDKDAATRYLCAGARLDENFARTVVRELRQERFRATAPSYGVDLGRVLGHAEQAVHQLRRRDLPVAAALLASLLLLPVGTAVYWVAGLFLLRGGAQTGTAASLRSRLSADSAAVVAGRKEPSFLVLARNLVIQVVVLVVACLIGSHVLDWLGLGFVGQFLLGLLLLVGAPWLATMQQLDAAWQVLREQLTPAAFAADTRRPATPPAGLPQSAVGGDANLIVYSGYNPFVGAGDEVTSWNFAMRLRPKGQQPGQAADTPPLPFGLPELVERLASDLEGLRNESSPVADRLPGLVVTERVFINGSELQNNPLYGKGTFWPGHSGPLPAESRPADTLPREQVVRARGLADGPVRHCLCAQIRSWGSDLVLSVFVQVTVTGSTLYVQANTLVLTPVREAYRLGDSIARARSEEDVVQAWADALIRSRGVLLTAPAGAISELRTDSRTRSRERKQRRAIANDRRYDFGASLSLRELASSHAYRNLFQRTDVTRLGKQIELQVLHTLAEFLAEHGLDLGELNQHREVILNHGIMMTGGVMTGSIAAGTGASATIGGSGGATSTQKPAQPDAGGRA